MKIGEKYRVVASHFYIDLDSIITKGITTEAFLGHLDALVTEGDLRDISNNFLNVIKDTGVFSLNKDDIIDIVYIEADTQYSDITYVEFTRNGKDDIEALSKLRLDCLELL